MYSIPVAENQLYGTWLKMNFRCNNPNDEYYSDYGGRGIRVCEAWRKSATRFLLDVGLRPLKDYSIDRVNNDMHYSCGVCDECVSNGWLRNLRWSSKEVQTWNQRMKKSNKSGYRGVRTTGHGTWTARISWTENGVKQNEHLGTFDDPEQAAIAFDVFAIFLRGEYGATNIL